MTGAPPLCGRRTRPIGGRRDGRDREPVDYERAEEHPRKFTAFRVTYHISGTDIEPERVERAISLSRDRYCSVEATLEPAVPMEHYYTIDDSEPVQVTPSAGEE